MWLTSAYAPVSETGGEIHVGSTPSLRGDFLLCASTTTPPRDGQIRPLRGNRRGNHDARHRIACAVLRLRRRRPHTHDRRSRGASSLSLAVWNSELRDEVRGALGDASLAGDWDEQGLIRRARRVISVGSRAAWLPAARATNARGVSRTPIRPPSRVSRLAGGGAPADRPAGPARQGDRPPAADCRHG